MGLDKSNFLVALPAISDTIAAQLRRASLAEAELARIHSRHRAIEVRRESLGAKGT
jgi:hypothetical protein